MSGFTLAEVLVVLVIIGIMATMALPRLDFAGQRSSGAMQFVGTTLLGAQRGAVTRQHAVVVAFDQPGRSIRLHYDRDNDARIDAGEEVRREFLDEGVVFGLGGASAHPVGSRAVTFTHRQDGLPAVTFHRNGSASEEGGIYLTTRRSLTAAHTRDARLVLVDRATGRPSWLHYTGTEWKREF